MTSGEAQAVPPPALPRRGPWDACASAALAALGFFAPFSSAGVALSLGALVLLAFLPPRRMWLAAPWREPIAASGLALFAFIAVHTLWLSGFTESSRAAVNHYQELLLLPILLAVMAGARQRAAFMRGLVAGALVFALMHWVAPAFPALHALVARRRISAGFVLAVCAFLLVMRSPVTSGPWPARLAAAFIAITVLYAAEGRTGYLLLIFLAAVAAWLHSPARWRWAAAGASLILAVALALGSGTVGERLKETVALGTMSVEASMTSTSIRVELMRVATDMAARNWVGGAGYANYSAVHEKAALDRFGDPHAPANAGLAWVYVAGRDNPHNEYLMHLIGGGIVALSLFLAWLALSLREARRAPPGGGAVLGGVVGAFAIGCLFNSLLLDFVEGHFYVALLACLIAQARAPRTGPRQAVMGAILVVATRQIGDVLLATPLVHAARERWPDARIDVIGIEGTLGMLRGNPQIDNLVETPARSGLSGARQLAMRLWRRYDLALITDPGDRAYLLGWVAAPRRAGIVPERGGSNWWKLAMVDHAVRSAGDLGERHVTLEKLALLEPWLANTASAAQVVAPPAKALPPDIASSLERGAVVVHAPSMWPYKQWPIAGFRTLVESLHDAGRQVVLTGSGAQRDQECIAALRDIAPAPRLLDVSGRLDFNQLVAVFERAALYIGPDTSVSHLAAATGVPVIAIFGPTNPMRWAPWPAGAAGGAAFRRVVPLQQVGNVTMLQSSLHCVPCGKAGCEDHRQSRSDCLVDIGADRVIAQARRILGET